MIKHPLCEKQQYKSKGAAEAHLRSVMARGNDFKIPADLCTYLCRVCNHWHVGHRPNLKTKPNRVRVTLYFDGECLWLDSPDGSNCVRVAKRRPGGGWSFYTMGSAHGKILDELLGGIQ